MAAYLSSGSHHTMFVAALPSRVMLLAFLLLAGACDSSDPRDEGPPTLNGTFTGIVEGTNETVSVRIAITESAVLGGKAVDGSGSLVTPGEEATFNITGSYLHPVVTLDFQFADRPPGTLTGQVSDDRSQITGTVAVPGVTGQVTLSKESD